jgi:hypothetical protein
LVKKALEDEMSAKNTTGESVAVESENDGGANVAKALGHVADIVKTLKGETVEESDTEKAKKATLGNMVKAMGFTKKADYDAQMAKLEKDFGLDANAKFQNQQPPVAKAKKPLPPAAADDDADDDETDDEDDDTTPAKPKAKAKKSEPALTDPVDMLMTAISKELGVFQVEKAKHLTKARIEKLKQVQEVLKLLITEVEEATQPTNPMPAGTTSTFNSSGIKDLEAPMEQPVIKSAEDLAVLIAKAVETANAPLRQELEAIKKAKPASQSLESETETKTAKSKSMWGGVL